MKYQRNGYVVEQYNNTMWLLSRVRGYKSNIFVIVGKQPIFADETYLNKTTLHWICRLIDTDKITPKSR